MYFICLHNFKIVQGEGCQGGPKKILECWEKVARSRAHDFFVQITKREAL